jgi:hypothetical protein
LAHNGITVSQRTTTGNSKMYITIKSKVVFESRDGERRDVCACADERAADLAAKRLNRALAHQYKNEYTASARAIARAETVPGFAWLPGSFAA